MLTNTVVLFLRDLLPMFIMFAYLSCVYECLIERPLQVTVLVASAFLFSIVVLFQYEYISDLAEGTGIEWLKMIFASLAFICFLFAQLATFTSFKLQLIRLASFLLLVIHINSFLLYFTIYFANTDILVELVIGCAIGIGICVSFYFLFSFILHELWRSSFWVLVLVLWSLFVANQFSFVADITHQIDLIHFGSQSLSNFSHWLNEESEYGFIFKALTGYDATPSILYGIFLIGSFVLMLSASLYKHLLKAPVRAKQSAFGASL